MKRRNPDSIPDAMTQLKRNMTVCDALAKLCQRAGRVPDSRNEAGKEADEEKRYKKVKNTAGAGS